MITLKSSIRLLLVLTVLLILPVSAHSGLWGGKWQIGGTAASTAASTTTSIATADSLKTPIGQVITDTDNITGDCRKMGIFKTLWVTKPPSRFVPVGGMWSVNPSGGAALTGDLYGLNDYNFGYIRQRGVIAYFRAWVANYTPNVHVGLTFEVWEQPYYYEGSPDCENFMTPYCMSFHRRLSTGNVISYISDNNSMATFWNDNTTVVYPTDLMGFTIDINNTSAKKLLGGIVEAAPFRSGATALVPVDDITYPSWEGTTSIFLQAFMLNPHFVQVGDSISSHDWNCCTPNPFQCVCPTYDNVTNVSDILEAKLRPTYGRLVWQNTAIAGLNSSQFLRKLPELVLDIHPNFAVVNIGFNDYGAGITINQYTANVTRAIQLMLAADIIPVMVEIIPNTASSDHTRWAFVDAQNAVLAGLAVTYPQIVLVKVHDAMGQFHTGGPAGNHWEIQTQYLDAPETTHPNVAGHTLIAEAITAALIARSGF